MSCFNIAFNEAIQFDTYRERDEAKTHNVEIFIFNHLIFIWFFFSLFKFFMWFLELWLKIFSFDSMNNACYCLI